MPVGSQAAGSVEGIAKAADRCAIVFCVAFCLTALAIGALRSQERQDTSPPTGATARCRDGTYSFSRHRSGTCSHHGGVAAWLEPRAARDSPRDDTASAARASVSDILPQAPAPMGQICGARCGVERWAVKTLSDPDRDHV